MESCSTLFAVVCMSKALCAVINKTRVIIIGIMLESAVILCFIYFMLFYAENNRQQNGWLMSSKHV